MMDIGARIKYFREESGLLQKSVAKALGLKKTNYSELENGRRNLYIQELVLLCKYYGITPNDFFEWNDSTGKTEGRGK